MCRYICMFIYVYQYTQMSMYVYICVHSHTHTYFLVLLQKGPRSNNIPVEISILSAPNLNFIYYYQLKNQGLVGEISVSGLQQRNHKKSQEQLVVPESKEVLKEPQEHTKSTEEPT